MKAYDLVAYDVDGARYCLNCARKAGIDVNEDKPASGYGGPVFASDLEGAEYCGDCGELIPGSGEEEEEEEEDVCGNPYCPSYVADLREPDHRCSSCVETSEPEEA